MTTTEMLDLVSEHGGVKIERYWPGSPDDAGACLGIKYVITYHNIIVGSDYVAKSFVEENIETIKAQEAEANC